MLLLPKIIAQFGFVLGIAILISFGLLAHLCQRILMGLIIKSGKLSYANVVSFYLGKNFGKFMVQFLVLAQFGTTLIFTSTSKPDIL